MSKGFEPIKANVVGQTLIHVRENVQRQVAGPPADHARHELNYGVSPFGTAMTFPKCLRPRSPFWLATAAEVFAPILATAAGFVSWSSRQTTATKESCEYWKYEPKRQLQNPLVPTLPPQCESQLWISSNYRKVEKDLKPAFNTWNVYEFRRLVEREPTWQWCWLFYPTTSHQGETKCP